MPPKPAEDTAALAINALCNILIQQESHKIDSNDLATVFGLSHGKNVPRKLTSILEPYGWKCEQGKIVKSDGAPAAPTTPGKVNGSHVDSDSTPVKAIKATPKTGKTSKAPNTPAKTPAKSKKRVSPDDDEDDAEGENTAEKPTAKKPKTPVKASKAKSKVKEESASEEEATEEVKNEDDLSDREA